MSNENTVNLFIDESNELSFDLTIEGTEMGAPVVRTIIEGEKFEMMFPTNKKDESWSVTIPPLNEVMGIGTRNLRLEVVINNKIFTPLTLVTEFKKSCVVEAKVVTKKLVNENTSPVKAVIVRKEPEQKEVIVQAKEKEAVMPSVQNHKPMKQEAKHTALPQKKTSKNDMSLDDILSIIESI